MDMIDRASSQFAIWESDHPTTARASSLLEIWLSISKVQVAHFAPPSQ